MDVDRTAPVVASREVEVNAPVEAVWAVLTAFEAWPTWNPDVSAMEMRGTLAPGTVFRWKAGPSRITSRIEEVQPPARIVWSGTTMGIRAVHLHELRQREGTTTVRSEESWSGLLPRLLRRRMHDMLGRSLESGLAALRAEAERHASRPGHTGL